MKSNFFFTISMGHAAYTTSVTDTKEYRLRQSKTFTCSVMVEEWSKCSSTFDLYCNTFQENYAMSGVPYTEWYGSCLYTITIQRIMTIYHRE